MNVAHEVCDNE